MTLTEISFYSRRAAPYAVVAVLIILILFYAFKILFLYLDTQKVTQVETNTIFGVIKSPKIQDALAPSGELNYTLDTIEGSPIIATASANVFFMPKTTTRFGFREKIALMAQSLDIVAETNSYKVVGQEAQIIDDRNTFKVDIASFNFEYQYALDRDPTIFDNVRVPGSDEVEEQAINLLREMDAYPPDLAQGKANIVYMRYDPTTTAIKVVDNPQEANMVEADFYRPDIGEYPVVAAKYFNSQNFVAMVFKENNFKVVKAQIKYYDTSKEQVGLYPLKTGEQAYQKLQAGEAMFIQLPQSRDIVIKKMFLAYLDPDVYQEYMQPVFVFLGENNFVAYVPAVADEYLAK